jgi:hypothetical protein
MKLPHKMHCIICGSHMDKVKMRYAKGYAVYECVEAECSATCHWKYEET